MRKVSCGVVVRIICGSGEEGGAELERDWRIAKAKAGLNGVSGEAVGWECNAIKWVRVGFKMVGVGGGKDVLRIDGKLKRSPLRTKL
jgi:hypothetical protein